MKIKSIFLAIVIGIIVAGCGPNKAETKEEINKEEAVKEEAINEANPFTDYGNGVYYYDFKTIKNYAQIRKEFGPMISKLLGRNTEIKISAVTPNIYDGTSNYIIGYWIFTEPRHSCLCDTITK